jgi:two-component system CheB/CheR fusion protein
MQDSSRYDTAFADNADSALVPEVLRRLSSARSLAEIISVVRYGARRACSADGVTFVLRDRENCHYWEEDAIGPLWKGQRFPMASCISGWCMLNNQIAVIDDVFADPRIPAEVYRSTFVKSLIMAPVGATKPVAAIGAYWAARRNFSETEVAIVTSIARAVPHLRDFAIAAE